MSEISEWLARSAARTIAALDQRFALQREVLAEGRGAREGSWNGRPLRLSTDIFTSPGVLARLQMTQVTSSDDAFASLTLVALPRCATGAPILGADLVVFRGALSFLALDLTPVAAALEEATAARLAAVRRRVSEVSEARPSRSPFSEHAILATPHRGTFDLCLGAYEDYFEAFVAELDRRGASASPLAAESVAAARRAQEAYFRSMSGHMKELPALKKLFGEPWAISFFDDLFFDVRAIA